MKFQDLAEGNDPAPEQSVVDRFAGVAASQRSYYIMKWAEKKGMDTDDAMHKAGYVRDGYMGAGAWNWRYVGMDESVQEADDEVDTGPTWKDDLEDALDGYPEWAHEYIKDGVCPECGGNGYMDGDYENEDGEENDECNGMYNYDCDEGEIRDNTWADELKSKEPEAPKQPAPSKEEIMKILPRLHDDYVKSGRYNAFELGGILKQMYPELNKREAGSYVADFLSTFKESKVTNELNESSDEVMVAKMLAKALGDENRWTEMSAPELYAELESTNPEVADMIRNLAKMLYDVRLQERAYKDVGVADTVKDQRGKEFNFDKSSKKFKSQDGEEADVTTKLGKDLMRQRKNHMKRTSPSYPKNKR